MNQRNFDANSNFSEGEEDQRINGEEVDNKSSDDDAHMDSDNRHHKRKRYHRHTLHQIQAMEG